MNKEIQTLIATQLIIQKDGITTHEYQNNKITEDKYLSILDSLKLAIKEGLEVMLPLDEEQLNTYSKSSYLCGTNGKITFIEKIMDTQGSENGLIEYLYEQITENDLKKAHPKFMSNIYNILNDNGISIKRMFELGFDFKQGNFDETDKAMSGNIDFFECCLCYKKDFNFSYEYEAGYTLKKAVEEEIEYKKGNKSNIEKEENLLNFIEKALVKQKLENKNSESYFKEIKLKI